jgi:protein-disulfide isomerase
MPKIQKITRGAKQFFIPALVVIAIGLAFFSGTLWQKVRSLEGGQVTGATTQGATPPAAPTVTLDTIKGLFNQDVIKLGDANSKVLFVEMADPSCPYCQIAGGYNPELAASADTQTNRFKYASQGGTYVPPVAEMEKLVKSGEAAYAYIYFPGHGNGEMGMKALYCANEQGKFWEAHNLLLSNAGYDLMNTTVQNDKTKSQAVADFLKSVIDPTFIKSCLDSGKYDSRLQADKELAQSLGIQGTPDFYVNATNFMGAYSWTDMQSTVDAALK